jgi:hypothetical protein
MWRGFSGTRRPRAEAKHFSPVHPAADAETDPAVGWIRIYSARAASSPSLMANIK